MRTFAIFAAALLVAAPLAAAPTIAYADGIERPRQRPRPAPRRERVELLGAPEAPRAVVSNEVTLPASFFAGSSGGVGADIGGGSYNSTTVVVRGASANASAFASASASVGARVGGRFGGRGGGHGCGCR